jgi:predicted acylesterase/phospholipase RssA
MRGKKGKLDSIGLCLSGGGFRASLFHLGVLRYLAESKQLSNVKVISSVSGGSVIGAFLAIKWKTLKEKHFSKDTFLKEIYEPFVKKVTTGNLRNRWFLLCVLTAPRLINPRFTWINLWSGFFDRWFYGGKGIKINELSDELELVINATELKFGKAYRFAPSFYGSDDEGDGEGYKEININKTFQLSYAVTASAAHLPLNMNIGNREGRWFIDGGAFDNTGLDWILDWEDKDRPKTATKPDFLIVCEASKELPEWSWGWRRFIPLYRILPILSRWRAIQYEQTRRTRKDWFIDRIRKHEEDKNKKEKNKNKKEDGIIISIDVVANELKEAEKRDDCKSLFEYTLPEILVKGDDKEGFKKEKFKGVEDIRTDLDNFLCEEAKLLTYHGYSLTHVYLTTFHENTKVKGRPLIVHEPEWRIEFTEEEVKKYLRALKECDKHFTFKRKFF